MVSAVRVGAVLVAAALALGACGSTPTAPDEPDPTGVEGFGAGPGTTAPPATTKPPAAPSYPASAKAYAQAVLTAWKQKKVTRLGELTTPEVAEKIIEIPGPPNQTWTYSTCTTATAIACRFFNAVGDDVALGLDPDRLGKSHAVVALTFEATEYPTDAIGYVRSFVGAWQVGNRSRMQQYSSADLTEYFTHFTPPTEYSTCDDGAAGSTYVRIYNADGLDYTVRVTNEALGKAHAITSQSSAGAICT